MRKLVLVFCAVWFTVSASTAAEKAPQKVTDFADATLAKFGADPVIVKAVKDENAKNKTLDQIKEADKKWMAHTGVNDFMKGLMDSECGKYLRGIMKSYPQIVEAFVMDNQGANVCMTNKTSDYWQGDEDKFTQSFKAGAGAVHMSEVKFDESIREDVVQVSVPVKDGKKAIGAITFGVNPRRMK